MANILSFIMLIYMCMCTYYGFFHLKIWSYYSLHPNQQTDSFSLLFSANQLTKLAPPLCFNFLRLFDIEEIAFNKMLNAMDPIPIIGL